MEKEGTEVEEKAIRYIAKAADGSMRDALSLLDQCIAFYLGEKLTYEKALDVLGAVDMEVFSELLRKVLAQDTAGSIKTLEELIVQGRELGQFVNDFVWYMRNLLLVKTSDVPEDAVDVPKIRRTVRAADTYIKLFQIDIPVRFDIITVVGENGNFEIEHIKEAFLPPLF